MSDYDAYFKRDYSNSATAIAMRLGAPVLAELAEALVVSAQRNECWYSEKRQHKAGRAPVDGTWVEAPRVASRGRS